MSTDTTYNGWTNRATWAWKLWLDNDCGTYNHWNELANELVADAARTAEEDGDKLDLSDVTETLAARLEEDAEEAYEAVIPPGTVWRDLFNLSDSNWDEIAENLLSEHAEAQ